MSKLSSPCQVPSQERKHCILLVTNRADVSRKLKATFHHKGHECQIVTNIIDLYRAAKVRETSLVLFDVNLFMDDHFQSFLKEERQIVDNTFIVLKDCCGALDIQNDYIMGNIELAFCKNTNIEDVGRKVNASLEKLEPIVFKKNGSQEADDGYYFEEIMGNSKKMGEVYRFIERVSEKRVNVVIMGETGTGKELVVRAIHKMSKDINRSLVSINCAAIPATLIESELFGHEKGAFTGAVSTHYGKLELADGGTLFLDEIGDMSLDVQARLLRAIESGEFTRLGGEKLIRADVRVISATNKDLMEKVHEGTFRSDLYYRLNVDSITVPPLRERKEDIPLLAGYFLRRNSDTVRYISPEALSILLKYSWPGNVRELKNCIKRALLYTEHEAILPEHLPPYLEICEEENNNRSLPDIVKEYVVSHDVSELPHNILKQIEGAMAPEILKKSGWNKKKTAAILGMAINTFKSRLREYETEREDLVERPR